MTEFLGIDTSNYTTSCALFSSENMMVVQKKKLLPVKEGELGIRQSDAVFHHTKQLPELMKSLFTECNTSEICGVGYSYAPTTAEGSYMPCFLVGECTAVSIGEASHIACFKTSHQIGHVLAALYSCDKLDYINKSDGFIAFHVSGGTTDVLLCLPDKENVLNVRFVASSLDLKAGQAVDRVGLMLGLRFPCGKELEKLALKSKKEFKCKPVIKDGSCCLSGLENICGKMKKEGESYENIAAFCLEYIYQTIRSMSINAREKYGNLPIVYAGGVMSNSILQNKLAKLDNVSFAEPEFSCDNAVGIAIYAAIKKGMLKP